MSISSEALTHFKNLLKINTVNPPGNEAEAIKYIESVLNKEGISAFVAESAPGRSNLVAKLKGDGSEKPLLLTSHVDVVPVEESQWKFPPFSATEADGCIWGRGAIDMKNMTAYTLSTFLNIARDQQVGKIKLKRDLVLAAVADEEAGGEYGMGFLTSKYPELVWAEYALNEVGGFTIHLGKTRIYTIQVGEKGVFWIRVKFKGEPSHGSFISSKNVHYRVANFIKKIESTNLPIHITKSTEGFLNGLAHTFGKIGLLPAQILKTPLAPAILKKLGSVLGDSEKLEAVKAMLTNTMNPTGIKSGYAPNVIPGEATITLDCRLLPGFKGQDVIEQLRKITGEIFDVEVIFETTGHENSFNTPLFKEITKQVLTADPGCHVIPNLTVGSTDAYYLHKIGVKCYGFTPVKFPPDLNFAKLFHGHNERIPVDGFIWGSEVFIRLFGISLRDPKN